jgi:hypothetical protein
MVVSPIIMNRWVVKIPLGSGESVMTGELLDEAMKPRLA